MTSERDIAFRMLSSRGCSAVDSLVRKEAIDPIMVGDAMINIAMNIGGCGCAEIVMLLAPTLALEEGTDGVMREALRLWRRVAEAISRAKTDEELNETVTRITRSFRPMDRHGRPLRAEGGLT